MISVETSDFYSWRETARELLKREIKPEEICWNSKAAMQPGLNFAEQAGESAEVCSNRSYLLKPVTIEEIKISRHFFEMAKNVACFRGDQRWPLLYSVAYRIAFENPRLLGNSIDEQISELRMMMKAVSRDRHKMKAFVRFKSIDMAHEHLSQILGQSNNNGEQAENLVAWFEPEHLILPITTSFFVKRFSNMNWSILTPDLCAHWDGHQVTYNPGIETRFQQSDELEELWLEYYKNIFNPARLKIKAMQSEMPKKYWKNLPEAVLIDELIQGAQTRTNRMIDQNYAGPQSKLTKSTYVKQQQAKLRKH